MLADLLAIGNAIAAVFLTGLSWTVAVVVYPAFADVGPTQSWFRYHAAHSRRIAFVVGPPWAVQGLTGIGLLFDRPAEVPLWLVLLAGAAALATVATTVVGAVPVHERLGQGFDAAQLRTLLRWHAMRTAAWTLSAGCGVAVLLLAQT